MTIISIDGAQAPIDYSHDGVQACAVAIAKQLAAAPPFPGLEAIWPEETEEQTIAAVRIRIRNALREQLPQVGYSLFPLSESELFTAGRDSIDIA